MASIRAVGPGDDSPGRNPGRRTIAEAEPRVTGTQHHHSSLFDPTPPPRALPWAIIQRPFRPYHRVPSIRAVGPGDDSPGRNPGRRTIAEAEPRVTGTQHHHSSLFDPTPPPRALPWAIIQRPFRPYHRVPSIRAVGPGRNLGDTMSTQSPTPRRGRSTQLRAERRLYRRSGTLGQIMPPNPHAAISQGSALGYCSATRGFAPGYRPAALQAARGGTSTRYNHSTTQQFNNSTYLLAALQAAWGTCFYPLISTL